MEIDTNEIRISANEIKLTTTKIDDRYITTNIVIDKNEQLYEWLKTLDENKMLPNQENFSRMFLGIWEKENPIAKKEGNKMIESINLIDLYANKHRESIEKETKEKVEELRKKCDVINKFNELVEQFEKDCDELYLSQFTEEEKNKMLLNPEIAFDNYKPLREKNICNGPTRYRYYTNDCIRNEEIEKVESDMANKIEEINDLVKTVKAHVGIAKTKEEVEEILTRYGIIDKKGKLVIK